MGPYGEAVDFPVPTFLQMTYRIMNYNHAHVSSGIGK